MTDDLYGHTALVANMKAHPEWFEPAPKVKAAASSVVADQLSAPCIAWLMQAIAMGLKPELAALRREIAPRAPDVQQQQKRLFSPLEIKAVDSDLREIEGLCSTNRRDRVFDVVEPHGLLPPSLPLPLLLEHDIRSGPIGQVFYAAATDSGVHFRARIPRITEGPPSLLDRIETVWAQLKARLLRNCSIGFLARVSTPLANGGRIFTSWELTEISICAIPANVDAAVYTVRAVSDV